MAACNPLVERSTATPLVSDAADANSEPHILTAFFLHPRARDGAAPPAPPGDPDAVPARPHGNVAEFKGWAGVPRRWPEWVDKLRRRHELLWRQLGILDGILASTYRVRRRDNKLAPLQLAAFWNEATATFVFPWGEATLTLDDIHVLAGLPLFGVPVRAPVSESLEKDVAGIESVRTVLNQSKRKKPSYSAWVEHFVDRTLEEEEEEEEEEAPSASGGGGGGGDREARELVEHGAFLSMWLSIFVLPGPPFNIVRREVDPLAARLARGESVALAPAALAAIYHDLSALKRRITSGEEKEPFIFSAPAHILQLWVWEHFTQLRPAPVGSSAPHDDQDKDEMPWAARWHKVGQRLSSKHIHAVFKSSKKFQWGPYGERTLFGLQPEKGSFWATATKEELVSLARCLHPCELVGMDCIQQYNPHRVARQLGFDQDIPGKVPRASSSWEKAWETYNIELETRFIFTSHKPGVTVQYAKWWKPYSSAYDSDAKMKEGHDVVVSAEKRKMEGVLAGSSGKKLCPSMATTATQGRPPKIVLEIISDDELNEETSKEAGVFVEAISKENALSTMHLKSPEMEHTTGATSRKKSGNSERFSSKSLDGNTELASHEVCTKTLLDWMKDASDKDTNNPPRRAVGTMETTENASAVRRAEIAESKKKVNTLNEKPCLPVATATRGRPPKIVIELISDDELDEETRKEAGVFVEATSKEDALSTVHLKSPEMEHSAGASRKKSGNNERLSSRTLEANTERDKDANNLPRREVGTIKTIEKASAARRAEITKLKKKVNTLNEKIQALEAAEKGKSPE